ncbi:MAG: hypothetical protein ACOCV1_02585 [Bacillota bacterium]
MVDYDNDNFKDIFEYESRCYDGIMEIALLQQESGKFYDTNQNIVFYLKKGTLHRTHGPAFISANGISWYENGFWHRLDGPARIYRYYSAGKKYKDWCFRGKRYSYKDFLIITGLELENGNEIILL